MGKSWEQAMREGRIAMEEWLRAEMRRLLRERNHD